MSREWGKRMSEAIATPEAVAATATPEAAPAAAPPVPSASAALSTPATPAAAEAPARPEWATTLDDDSFSMIQNKGWDRAEDPIGSIVKAYQNLERLRGVSADKLAKIPNWDNQDEVAEFRARLGVPEAADQYESPEVWVGENQLNAGELAPISLALGHTPQQHAQFAQAVGEYLGAVQVQQQEARNAQLSAEKVELERAWGPALEENMLAANRAKERFGISDEQVDAFESAIGYRATIEHLSQIGRALGEHKSGLDAAETSARPFGLTRDAAAAEIKALQSDREFFAKLKAGDTAAKARWQSLQEVAFHS